MHKITKRRFDAIAGYARSPQAVLTGEEIGYFETDDNSLLGLLVRDRTDRDFAGMAFGRDARFRFRWTSMTAFSPNPSKAFRDLEALLKDLQSKPSEFHHQGDEVGPPVDFFEPRHVNEKLHPDFLTLSQSRGFTSAKAIIEVMMRWHEDLDGNFVEQFQSTAFDQRIWELYLFALLIELGYAIDPNHAVPDFIVGGLKGKMAIEAVTVGPTIANGRILSPPTIETVDKLNAYLSDYMPIKFGSPLFSKLRKEYWKQPQISGMPLVFAISDFSSPESMLHSRPALERYCWFPRGTEPVRCIISIEN